MENNPEKMFYINKIKLNEEFEDLDYLKKCFDLYQDHVKQTLTVAKSGKISASSEKVKKHANHSCQYEYIKYDCKIGPRRHESEAKKRQAK